MLLKEKNNFSLVLVTGATGLAGWAFTQEFHQNIRYRALKIEGLISSVSRSPQFWPETLTLNRGDLSNLDEARRIVRIHPWNLIVHADRICRLKFCENHPEVARRINVLGTKNLVTAIQELLPPERPRLVFCSTDHVFSGDPGQAPFFPDSPREPITIYGKMMMEAEDFVLNHLENKLLIRNGLLLGGGPLGTTGPIDWIQERLREKKPVSLFENETRTPLGVRCLGRIGAQLACSSRTGVVHLSMRTRINRYELGLKILREIGYGDCGYLIQKADRRNDWIQRVQELVLDDSTLEELRPKELDEVLKEDRYGFPVLAENRIPSFHHG